jgi:ketosteroid isomerase-like protein
MGSPATQSEAMAAVQDIIEPWNQACLSRDWDSLLSMCTDDIVFMPPGAPPVSGDAVRPWLDEFPTIKAMSWEVTSLEGAEDLAFLRGPVRQTLEVDGEIQEVDGKYCDLMRRGDDGRWRFAVIIWSDNSA